MAFRQKHLATEKTCQIYKKTPWVDKITRLGYRYYKILNMFIARYSKCVSSVIICIGGYSIPETNTISKLTQKR